MIVHKLCTLVLFVLLLLPVYLVLAQAPAGVSFPSLREEGLFYMYDEPVFNYTHILPVVNWPNVKAPWNKQYHMDYMPEPYLFQALRTHRLRTTDPAKAKIFIVPILVALSHVAGHCMWNHYHRDPSPECDVHYSRMGATANALRESRWWKAHRGRDHVMFCHHWQCLWDASYTAPLHKVFRRSIVYYFEGTDTEAINNKWCDEVNCAALGSVHRVLPYVDNPHRWEISQLADPFPRNQTAFFSGNCSRSVWYHVREYMWTLSKQVKERPDLKDWSLVHYGNNPTPKWSAGEMLRTKYCLCPAGDSSTSARMYYAIAAGCVPVIIAHDDIWNSLPFVKRLDWRSFALFIKAKPFQSHPLATLEAALKAADYQQLHRALRRVAPSLSILHPHSRVANTLVRELLGP